MRKRAPNSKGRKTKRRNLTLIIGLIFVVFAALILYLYYVFLDFSNDGVALVNGEKITSQQLDFWYKMSVNPDSQDVITKQYFLNYSLIPQEILFQEAKDKNIEVSDDEVEFLIGQHIIDNRLTIDDFEDNLALRGITIEDVRESFETRAAILKLLEMDNVNMNEAVASGSGAIAFQVYINELIENSEIEIFPQNIKGAVLGAFEATGDEICGKGKPIVRLYTASWCGLCNSTIAAFGVFVENYVKSGEIEARHWSLDLGDDLLSEKKEDGIPENEAEIFGKYSPDGLVPAVVLGCKYRRIGVLGANERLEFMSIMEEITGE
jgi:thiol-disulfide isomerase/thioredoxin